MTRPPTCAPRFGLKPSECGAGARAVSTHSLSGLKCVAQELRVGQVWERGCLRVCTRPPPRSSPWNVDPPPLACAPPLYLNFIYSRASTGSLAPIHRPDFGAPAPWPPLALEVCAPRPSTKTISVPHTHTRTRKRARFPRMPIFDPSWRSLASQHGVSTNCSSGSDGAARGPSRNDQSDSYSRDTRTHPRLENTRASESCAGILVLEHKCPREHNCTHP